MRTSYDVVEMWSRVMYESLSFNMSCDGAKLSKLFLNRTFELETGTVFVDAHGSRSLQLDVYAYDERRKQMVVRLNPINIRYLSFAPNGQHAIPLRPSGQACFAGCIYAREFPRPRAIGNAKRDRRNRSSTLWKYLMVYCITWSARYTLW